MLINFDDGIFEPTNQKELHRLSKEITIDELNKVEKRLYEILSNISKKRKHNYKVTFMPNILLQIALKNKTPIMQYGAHLPFDIKIIKMSDKDQLLGKISELIILAHEIGHAILDHRNYTLDENYGTWLMEKITDEVAKFKLINLSPNFYKMYCLCRDTHHYKTKEGDFKEFFKPIIVSMENDWLTYGKNNNLF